MLKNARAFSHHKNVENEPTTVIRSHGKLASILNIHVKVVVLFKIKPYQNLIIVCLYGALK